MPKYLASFVCLVAGYWYVLWFSFVTDNWGGGGVVCSLKAIVGGLCGYNQKDRKCYTEIVPSPLCNKDIDSHKSTYKFTGR